MKLTNGEIFDAQKPLAELAPQKMPVKTSLAVLKLKDLIKPIAAQVEQLRNKFIQEYGEQGPSGFGVNPTILIPDPEHDGRKLQVPNPKWEPFTQDYTEVRSVEVELDFVPVALPDSVELSPVALMALEKFIRVI